MRLAVIGDVHGHFDETDVAQLDERGYDALLFVGDLAGYVEDGRRVARNIAQLRAPALVIPGNHDAAPLPHLVAEVMGLERLRRVVERGQDDRCAALERALGDKALAAYSLHDLASTDDALTVIAARPHSFGGPRLAFRRHLASRHGVETMEASTARLRELVDRARHEDLLFLAHNGPTGLGAEPTSIWGRDFGGRRSRLPDDFGDPDLRDAIDYAKAQGRRVRAVVAGHMHHAVKGGGARRWREEREGTLYVNAAQVPRIRSATRHHIALTLEPDRVSAKQEYLA